MKAPSFSNILIATIIIFSVSLVHSENNGAANMILEGGKTGKVPFPHLQHQKAMQTSCQICHGIFPQEKGIIEKLKQEGSLKNKSVMNNCISCHKDTVSKGKTAGPIKCKDCHSL